MTIEYSTLVPECLPDVVGCPDLLIERALRDAAIELATRGHIWMVEQYPEAFSVGQEDMYLDLPTKTRLVSVLSVKYGDYQLEPYNPLDLDQYSIDWRTATGSPRAYIVLTEKTLKPIPIPDTASDTKFYVTFAVAPTRESTGLPDELMNRWHAALVAGALSRLMTMRRVVWSDPTTAGIHRAFFERGVSEAKYMAATARANAHRVVYRAIV